MLTISCYKLNCYGMYYCCYGAWWLLAWQGDDLQVSKRLNVLEMMKAFRSNMDSSDDEDTEQKGNDLTDENVADTKSTSPDHNELNSVPARVLLCFFAIVQLQGDSVKSIHSWGSRMSDGANVAEWVLLVNYAICVNIISQYLQKDWHFKFSALRVRDCVVEGRCLSLFFFQQKK